MPDRSGDQQEQQMSWARNPSVMVGKRSSRDAMLSMIAVFGPIAVYLALHLAFALSDIWALTIGAAVAASATTYQAVSRGRPNSIAVLVMIELGLSIVLVLTTHNPHILLYKPAILLSVIGLYLLGTCVWGRPAAYETALSAVNRDPARGAAFERECGHIGCCDSSPNQHASKHQAATGHPIVTSFEPGERWFYDYRTEEFFAGPKLPAPQARPLDQPVPGPAGAVPSNWKTLLHE